MTSTALAGGPATRRRRASTITWRALTYVALFLIMAPATWLLLGVVARALPHWRWSVLWTTLTPTGGGLRDQILGTLILMFGVFLIAGSIGVLAGIHLAELARPRRRSGKASGGFLRTASDILSGFPSIVLGYVGYTALVVGLHWDFSLLPTLIILSIMVIPYIAKTTENSLRQVPTGYREGAEALGMSMGYGLRKVILKSALPGIVTGLLLALAIACGETAPLIYTAGFAPTLPHALTGQGAQFPYLTYVVYQYYNAPEPQYHYLAFDAALILVVIVMLLLVSSRIVVARTQRHSESARGTRPKGRRRQGTAPPDLGLPLH